MDLSVAQKARVLQPGNQPQNSCLFSELQVILKSHQIVGISAQIFLAQLHHGIGLLPGSRVS